MSGRSSHTGSGSSSRSLHIEDDGDGIRTPTQHHPMTTSDDTRLYLSSGGIWWNDRRIVDILGHSFTDTYNEELVTNWSNASLARRDALFNYFSSRVRSNPGCDLRAAFEERIKTRITVPINRA